MSAKSSFDFYSFAEGFHRYATACTIPKNKKMALIHSLAKTVEIPSSIPLFE
jgi:hypothetical protein